MVTHNPIHSSYITRSHAHIRNTSNESCILVYLYLYFECPFNNMNLWYYATAPILTLQYGASFCRSDDDFILTTDIDTDELKRWLFLDSFIIAFAVSHPQLSVKNATFTTFQTFDRLLLFVIITFSVFPSYIQHHSMCIAFASNRSDCR